MRTIELTQGKVALVDDEDFHYLSQWTWHASKHGKKYYAENTSYRKNKSPKITLMHRLILEAKQIDHIDGNSLNNQKENLRACNKSQNAANQISRRGTSKYKGVCWCKRNNKWLAKITVNYKCKHLGYFINEIDAASAYDHAALEYFGEFASLNFTEENDVSY